jgi:hypothetical protein
VACLQPEGGRNRQLRPLLAQLPGIANSQISPGRMSYGLRRLRLHGLIERLPKTQRYRLTTFGLKTALFYSRAYQRLLRRGLSELHEPPNCDSSLFGLRQISQNLGRVRRRKTRRLKLDLWIHGL